MFLLVGTLSIFLLNSCAKDAENLNGTISGLVTDYTNANAPIAGATVTLNTRGLTKTTGSDGRYEFVGIEPGTYSLQISANNYQTTTKQVTVYSGQTANCDVQLTIGSANVGITPESLTFGKDVEQLSFTITNNSTQSLVFSISNAPDFVEVSPASGTIAAKAQKAISVHVLNRSTISSNRTGQLTVNIGNDSYIVSLAVTNSTTTDPDQGDDGGDDQGGGGSTGDIAVTRGLLAFYDFNQSTADNSYRDNNNGVINGSPTFVTHGAGKAISFDQRQSVSIPNNMLNGKEAYSISLWLKNFGSGMIFGTLYTSYYNSPSFYVNNSDKLTIIYNGNSSKDSNFSLQPYQSSGWHMLTVTFNGTSKQILVYMDGQRVDAITAPYLSSTGESMTIGGSINETWADPMIVDDVRIHSITLSDEEVKTIFDSEK